MIFKKYKTHVCELCKKQFHVDILGRRESDYIKSSKHCDLTCNLAAVDVEEGRSIFDVVMMGSVDVAARRVLNVFNMHEFARGLKAAAAARDSARLAV